LTRVLRSSPCFDVLGSFKTVAVGIEVVGWCAVVLEGGEKNGVSMAASRGKMGRTKNNKAREERKTSVNPSNNIVVRVR